LGDEIGPESISELLILRTLAPPKLRHEGLQIVEDPPEEEEEKKEILEARVNKLLDHELTDTRSIDIALARPATKAQVSKERYEQLVQGLSKSFLKKQLFEYYHTQDTEGILPKLQPYATKNEIINEILSNKWGVAVSNDIPERLDVLVNRDFQKARRDIFFILGKGLFFFPFHIARWPGVGEVY